MSDNSGFFVRDNLGQTPEQQGSCWSSCPDIVLAGTNPAADPSVFLGGAGYATDYGSTVYEQTPNFVYARALNTNSEATAAKPFVGRVWFYWIQSDLVLWPQNWSTAQIKVAGQDISYQDIVATAANQVCMADLPFVWTPPKPAPNTHFCLITWVEHPPAPQPVNPAPALGYMGSMDELTRFVLDHHNMGWRNTTDVAGLGLTWSQTANITGPKIPGVFYLGVQCSNMPTDGQLGFAVPGPTPQIPPIISNMGPITNKDMTITVPISNWPGGVQSSITVNYIQGPTAPPRGANVTVTIMVPHSDLSEKTLALARRKPERLRVLNSLHGGHGARDVAELQEPIFVTVIGSQAYNF